MWVARQSLVTSAGVDGEKLRWGQDNSFCEVYLNSFIHFILYGVSKREIADTNHEIAKEKVKKVKTGKRRELTAGRRLGLRDHGLRDHGPRDHGLSHF